MNVIDAVARSTTVFNDELPGMLANLDSICFDKDAMNSEEWKQFFEHNKTWMLCWYTINNEPVAAAVVTYSTAGIGYLYSNAVHPDVRRQGLGAKLLSTRLLYIKDIVKRVQAHTRIDNKSSVALLRRFGFKAVQYIPDLYGDYRDGILWERLT